MPRTITISDELYARLESLARPFQDREAEDVILRLVEGESKTKGPRAKSNHDRTTRTEARLVRAPRERGAVVELNGKNITADTVPDLCTKVMEYLYSKGLWEKLEELAPYKTSSQRYLFSKSPKHPKGNDFFVPVQYRNVYMEAHKNYQTTIVQLTRLLARLGVDLIYRGS